MKAADWPEEGRSGRPEPEGRDLRAEEVPEGEEEFLEALWLRLNQIVRKPSGRFVISYIPGKPGSRTPPRVQ